jgi:CelD/BcsL family acetyltransferase involved in cellulose biosynthesis
MPRMTLSAIDQLADAEVARWNALLQSAVPVKSAFLSYDFARAVNDVRGGVSVIAIRGDDGEEGFLPFQIRRGRKLLGHAEKVAGGMSDFFGVVGNFTGPLDAGDLLRAAGLSAFRFDHAVGALCPFAFEDAERSQGARLMVDDFEQFKAGLLISNKKFVQSVLSRERRLAAELGEIVFRWHAEEPTVALGQLITAKRNQYRRTGVADSFRTAWHRALLDRLLRTPMPACTATVSTLHAGGQWIGSKYGLICGDTLHSWFSVYDPQHRRHGPGHLVWFRTLEEGCRRGIRVFDFGEGDSNYKREYGGTSYDVFKGAIRLNTLRGQSERVLQSIAWRLEKAGRHGPEPAAEIVKGRDA